MSGGSGSKFTNGCHMQFVVVTDYTSSLYDGPVPAIPSDSISNISAPPSYYFEVVPRFLRPSFLASVHAPLFVSRSQRVVHPPFFIFTNFSHLCYVIDYKTLRPFFSCFYVWDKPSAISQKSLLLLIFLFIL